MAGGSIGGGVATVSFSSVENLALATNVANTILAGLQSGDFTPVFYPGAGTALGAPAAGNGVAVFNAPTAQPVVVSAGNPYVIVNANGPVSIQGGAAGGTVLAGAGLPGAPLNLSYTDITPSGLATDTIVVTDGNNLIQTAAAGGGNYVVATGSGNDTVNILAGNGTVDPGSGSNQVNLGSGANLVTSTGFDTISGAPAGGGTDTVDVTSGMASINTGSSGFLINDISANPLAVALGTGPDTMSLSGSAAATLTGPNTTTLTDGTSAVLGVHFGTGDFVILAAGTSTTASANGNDTIQGLAGDNLIAAGTGNDTLLAGTGSDTLMGGVGSGSNTALVSGTGAGTTFAFIDGKTGGSDTISGLKSSDTITFTGYGASPLSTAIQSGSNTILTLSDGTQLTIAGPAAANPHVLIG